MFERSRVASRHLRGGVALEPSHEALLGALREKVHYLVEFEIDEDRAVRAALFESEIVHAENPDLPDLRQGRGLDPPQKSVTSGDDAQLQGQPGARPAAKFEGNRQQSLLQPGSLTGARTDLGQPLAEDLSLARKVVAEEAASMDLESHRDPMPRQVRGGAQVATMHPSRAVSADRAGRSRRVGTNRDAHAPGFHTQPLEFQTSGEQFVTCDDGSHAAFLLTQLYGTLR